MITLTRPVPAVKSSPVVLFDSAALARPARFGAGILASAPVDRVGYTAGDAEWWAAECARLEEEREAHEETRRLREAEQVALLDRYSRYAAWDQLDCGHLTDEDVARVGAVG